GLDSADGVAVSAAGLFVVGSTTGVFPNQAGGGGQDAYVARIVDTPPNTAPSNLVLGLSASTINENSSVTLDGSFTDPDATCPHPLVIGWDPGGGPTTLSLAAGVTAFRADHLYLDDNATGTASDIFPIHVSVADASTSISATTSLTVNNLAPTAGISGPA